MWQSEAASADGRDESCPWILLQAHKFFFLSLIFTLYDSCVCDGESGHLHNRTDTEAFLKQSIKCTLQI